MAAFVQRIQSHGLYQRLNGNLTTKLASAFATIALLSLMVGIAAIVSVNVSNAQLQELVAVGEQESDLLQGALSSFVEARTEDISFLRVYPERGLNFAVTQHVRPWERQIENLNATLDELRALIDGSAAAQLAAEAEVAALSEAGSEVSIDDLIIQLPELTQNQIDELAEIDEIAQTIADYETKFSASVTVIRAAGEEGQEQSNIGETAQVLVDQIASTESAELQASMLRLRHLEFTYLQTNSTDLVTQHGTASKNLRDAIIASEIDEAAKPLVIVALDAYVSQFNDLVTTTEFINGNVTDYQLLAVTAEEKLRTRLDEAVAENEAAAAQAVATIRNTVTILGILSLVTFVVSLLAAIAISRGINVQIGHILRMFGRLQAGDFSARAAIVAEDDLGQIAESINSVLDNNAELIQTQDESEAIQRSIARLQNDIATAAEGDLTTQAVVTNDVTGAIADSFNFMIEQLRDVITQVRDASLQVSSSANEIQTTAEHLAQGSQQQSEQIVDTTSAIDEMSVSIQRVSDNAALCAVVSEQARTNSDIGAEAVQQTILSMAQIQGQVSNTADQLQRLRLSMREIDNVIRIIDSIAERTGILAINASIQAAAAGSARQSFILVATEVDDLAQRSGEATQQIAKLVRQIQRRANAATSTIVATNFEVRQGMRLANLAGERLLEIESVADRLAELIQQISQAAKQQARGSETIAQSMGDISSVTQQNAVGTQEATVSIRNLAQLADELRASVSAFKLGADTYGAFVGD